MGFRTGAYAKVWSVEPKSDTWVKCRINISKKNQTTGEWEQSFGGFVDFNGSACAKKAAALQEGAKIKLGDVDVINKYNRDTGDTYVYYKVYTFETFDAPGDAPTIAAVNEPKNEVDGGEFMNDSRLPF